jgi:hypothetical protein
MPNNIKTSGSTSKISTTRNTNFKIGVDGSDDYGPTSNTGFWKGITPPSSGYTIYVHRVDVGPSIHVANDDNQCIFFLKSFGATGSTISEVLSWSTGRTDMWVQSSDISINDITGNTPQIVTDGLQFNLKTAPSSGSSWNDTSGNGRNATINGTYSYVSNNGGGIKLNNTDYNGTGYISVPYNISSNTATIEIVASFNNTSHWATIWGNEAYSFSRGYFAYMGTTTSLIWGSPTSNTTNVTITASNEIRHWVFIIDGTTKKLYLNGSEFATATTNNPTGGYVTSEFLFGARHTNVGTGATDKLNNSNSSNQPVFYQMRVYNKALSSSEVTTNFNEIKSTYGL